MRQIKKRKQKAAKVEKPPEKVIKFEATKEVHAATPNGMLDHTIGRLMTLMKSHGAEAATQSEQDFGVTAFAKMAPRDAAEALLIQQMIACHEVGLNMLTRAKHTPSSAEVVEAGGLAAKLLGLFERQFTALMKARKPPQVVTVEHVHRHLHVNGGEIPGATGASEIIQGQAHEPTDPRALAIAPGPALLGQDPPRDVVPVASDKARSVPNARRRTRDRRTKR